MTHGSLPMACLMNTDVWFSEVDNDILNQCRVLRADFCNNIHGSDEAAACIPHTLCLC